MMQLIQLHGIDSSRSESERTIQCSGLAFFVPAPDEQHWTIFGLKLLLRNTFKRSSVRIRHFLAEQFQISHISGLEFLR